MQAMNPSALHRRQIFVGVAVGPSVFGKLAPSCFQLFCRSVDADALNSLGIPAVLIGGLKVTLSPSAAVEGLGR
jgi:hypothetical protein